MTWLVSRRFDLAMFLWPAAIGLALVPLEPLIAPDGDTPLPFWILMVLVVDVAHVWATIYRTYLDPIERQRHPVRYVLVPIFAYAALLVLASISTAAFWTGLAYLAVFHFVRQQYGWIALYQRRDPGITTLDRWLDASAIYLATLFPLVWWHAHLPRRFDWFLPGDFVRDLIPAPVASIASVLYALALLAFALRQAQRGRSAPIGKIIVVATTAATWLVGIVLTDSDFAFTVTNVLIHGVPYFGLVWIEGQKDPQRTGSWLAALYAQRRVGLFLGILWALAYLEELHWDRLIWHSSSPIFFGPSVELGVGATALVLPLLALPQASHYLLDGLIWRKKDLAGRRQAGG